MLVNRNVKVVLQDGQTTKWVKILVNNVNEVYIVRFKKKHALIANSVNTHRIRKQQIVFLVWRVGIQINLGKLYANYANLDIFNHCQ